MGCIELFLLLLYVATLGAAAGAKVSEDDKKDGNPGNGDVPC
jgi:hypothetical protein